MSVAFSFFPPHLSTQLVTSWLSQCFRVPWLRLFLHKFSNPYMPLANLFKNCVYYWGFAAVVGFPLVHSSYQAPGRIQVFLGLSLWLVSQLTNFAVHYQLANMRDGDGDNKRDLPRGPLFSVVTSPNYTAEFFGWVGWSALSNIFMGYAFTLGGFIQMADWAAKKYQGYKKSGEDGEKYAKSRKRIIPFLF